MNIIWNTEVHIYFEREVEEEGFPLHPECHKFVSLQKFSECETLITPFYKGTHTSCAIFGLTPGHDTSTIGFNMFKFKMFEEANFLSAPR